MWNRRNIWFGDFRLRWDFKLDRQYVELCELGSDRYWYLALYWNRLLHPSTWFLCRTNGAVKGKDNCYDFNFALLMLHFSYTNYQYWKYKERG